MATRPALRSLELGPGKVESMTLEAIEVAKNADVRLYEAYTALWPEDELTKLEALIVAD